MQTSLTAAPYQFGFSEFTTWPWAYKRDLVEYKKHGASVIEVCEFKLAHGDYGNELKLAAEAGLKIASVQAGIHSIFPDSMASTPTDPRDRVAAIKEAIALSAPDLPQDTPFIVITGIAPEKNIRKAIERTTQALKELGEFAAQHRVKIAFEPLNPVNLHTDTAVWRLDQGLELVDAVNHPAVGICIDTWNVFQTPNLSDLIRQCAERILVVQMSDWRTPRSTADRYSLGDGEIPLAGIISSIRASDYRGPWLVEILSSFHLEGSLWKSDLGSVLEANRQAFEQLWRRTSPTPSAAKAESGSAAGSLSLS